MKTLDIKKANESLAHYALKAQKEPILITENGQPLATLSFVGEPDAEEDLSNNPRFMAMLDNSYADYKAHGGYTLDEVCRMFGIKPRKFQPVKPPSATRRRRRKTPTGAK